MYWQENLTSSARFSLSRDLSCCLSYVTDGSAQGKQKRKSCHQKSGGYHNADRNKTSKPIFFRYTVVNRRQRKKTLRGPGSSTQICRLDSRSSLIEVIAVPEVFPDKEE